MLIIYICNSSILCSSQWYFVLLTEPPAFKSCYMSLHAWHRLISKWASLHTCQLWLRTPLEYLDRASLLADCPEGIGLYESSNPWITQPVCLVICRLFTHGVVNVWHFSDPEEALLTWLHNLSVRLNLINDLKSYPSNAFQMTAMIPVQGTD